MRTKGEKIIACLLVFIFTFTYLSMIKEVFALDPAGSYYEPELVGNNDIKVLAGFYEDSHLTKALIADYSKNYSLVLQIINMSASYIDGGSIFIDTPNFTIPETLDSDIVSKVDKVNNGYVINLNRVDGNGPFNIIIPITPIRNDIVKMENFSRENLPITFDIGYVTNNGKQKNISLDYFVSLKWNAEKNVVLERRNEKYFKFTTPDGERYSVVQFDIATKIQDNAMPALKERIKVTMPKLNSILPENVIISPKSMKQIKGTDDTEFSSADNYYYDLSTGVATVVVENHVDSNGYFSWKKDAEDVYTFTGLYKADPGSSINVPSSAESRILSVYSSSSFEGENVPYSSFTRNITVDESEFSAANALSVNVTTKESRLSKGQILANFNTNERKETLFNETISANIQYADFINNIEITQLPEIIFDGTNTTGEDIPRNKEYVYTKKVKVRKDLFDDILGEDGRIEIYNNDLYIAPINTNSRVNDSGEYEIDVASQYVGKLVLKTTKPLKEGNLIIGVQKAIKNEVCEMLPNIMNCNKLNIKTVASVEFVNDIVTSTTGINMDSTIDLTDPETKAELTMNKGTLSTIAENKDVKLTAVLRTDSLDYKLYKNPVIDITLPRYVIGVNLKDANVRFETNNSKLDLSNASVVDNTDGTKTIHIELSGIQKEYTLDAVSKGVNIEILTDMTVGSLTPTITDKITMNVLNTYDVNETKTVEIPVKFVAPSGVVTISTVDGFADGASQILAVSENKVDIQIKAKSPAREANFKMYVINNYTNTLSNVAILGRTMFEGNKEVDTNSDLKTNMNLPLASTITVNGVEAKVYYSENGNATKDLTASANGWVENPSDLSKVKSYLIVPTGEVGTGTTIEFGFKATIPGNLDYNKVAASNYAAYFKNNLPTGAVQDKQVGTIFNFATETKEEVPEDPKPEDPKPGEPEEGPATLNAKLTSSVDENTEIKKDDTIKLSLNITNTSDVTAKNVIATVCLPTSLVLINDDGSENELAYPKFELGNIKAGKTVTKEFNLKVKENETLKEEIETKVVIEATNIEKNINLTVKNKIKMNYFSIGTCVNLDGVDIREGDNLSIDFCVTAGQQSREVENTIVDVVLPKEIEYISVDEKDKYNVSYNKSTNTIKLKVGTVGGGKLAKFTVNTKIGKLDKNVYDKEVKLLTIANGDNAKEQVYETLFEISKPGIKVEQSCDIQEGATITAYEDFKYVFTVENLSNLELNTVKLTDILPAEVQFSEIVVRNSNSVTNMYTEEDDEGHPYATLRLAGKAKANVEVFVRANALSSDKKITNKARISCDGMEDIYSNEVSHTIEKYVSSSGETVGGDDRPSEDVVGTKRIMGTVWIDADKDGSKGESETKVSNVEMMLFDNAKGKLVRNSSGEVVKVFTSETGVYTFDKVEPGKYTVMFMYDTSNYSATTYHKEGVDETKNSDAIDAKVTLDGIERVAAITEEVVVSDKNIYNLDLGIIENAKFDLSLNKTVSQISSTDSRGTVTINYNDAKLAKKDLEGKRINDTTIAVEYKITITNEGAIPGYVKKVVDYIPNDMKFNSELNRDWYADSNGKVVYNSSLSNTIINPGETKELTLVLTKKMNENNLGVISNTAEIFEAYNERGLMDVDSFFGNKVTTEDDISSADVLITVKTGQEVLYIGLAVTVVTIITTSAIIIKKKVLGKEDK